MIIPRAPTKALAQKRRGLRKPDAHREGVDLLDGHVLVAADGHGRRRWIGGIFPVEHHVVGGERLPIMPLHVRLELPGCRRAIPGKPAVLEVRNLCGQDGHQISVDVPRRKRLVEDARPVLVLRAHGEVRIEQGRALPPQHLEGASTAALGRFVFELGLSNRDAGMRQYLVRERGREPQLNHFSHETAPGHFSGLHQRDEAPQMPFTHDADAPRCRGGRHPRCRISPRLTGSMLAEDNGEKHALFLCFEGLSQGSASSTAQWQYLNLRPFVPRLLGDHHDRGVMRASACSL